MNKEKIALITIRYGLEVGGGAETLVRKYAETLSKKYDVEVITTKAKDYVTWANVIEADEEIINGVRVLRFPVDLERKLDKEYSDIVEAINSRPEDVELGEKFLKVQGPYSTPMWEYLESHKDTYKYYVYCPYLYAPAYYGLQITPRERNVLIPAAHDEPFIYCKVMGKEFKNAGKVIFLTEEELDLVNKIYPFDYEASVIGMGIDTVEPSKDFLKRYNLKKPYMVYVGRIDGAKGVLELIDFFVKFKARHSYDIDLVLGGQKIIEIPEREDVKYIGFLSEEDKYAAMTNAKILALSSPYESFSIATLEALKLGTPVLVNGKCEVLKGHCLKGNAGLWYTSFREFEQSLLYFLTHDEERKEMGKNGKVYVAENYSNEVIDKKLFDFLP